MENALVSYWEGQSISTDGWTPGVNTEPRYSHTEHWAVKMFVL